MKFLIFIILITCAFHVKAEVIPTNRLSFDIQIEKTSFYVFEDIEFSLVLTPRVSGDLPTWDTTEVYFEIVRLQVLGEPIIEGEEEQVISGNFDQLDERTLSLGSLVGEQPIDALEERIITRSPEQEFVFRNAGEAYSRDISLSSDVYPINDYELTSLPFGIYRLKVRYYLSTDPSNELYEEAKIDFVITAEDKVIETIDFLAAKIASSETLERDYIQAIDDIEYFTSQFYVSSDSSIEARQKGAVEYSLWARYIGFSKNFLREPDTMREVLEPPKSLKSFPLELYDFGCNIRTVDTPSIDLAGKVKIFISGFESILISNHRQSTTHVEATRVEYDSWKATVPLFLGVNRLTLVASDLKGLEQTTTITVTRE